MNRPVYELLGRARDSLLCYGTGADTDWYTELDFIAVKLACPYGPADGYDALRKNVELVRRIREQVGNEVEIMLDRWMAFDVDCTVLLAEALRPSNVWGFPVPGVSSSRTQRLASVCHYPSWFGGSPG